MIWATNGGPANDDSITVLAVSQRKSRSNRTTVAQSKRAALKLRRQKAHRMHCRGRRS